MPTFPLASDIHFAGALDEVNGLLRPEARLESRRGNRGIVLGALHRSKTLWFWNGLACRSKSFWMESFSWGYDEGFWKVVVRLSWAWMTRATVPTPRRS